MTSIRKEFSRGRFATLPSRRTICTGLRESCVPTPKLLPAMGARGRWIELEGHSLRCRRLFGQGDTWSNQRLYANVCNSRQPELSR